MNILGLAVATTEHHAACLVRDGHVIAAVEEERLNRIKHYGAPGGVALDSNLISDPTLALKDVLCKESVAWVLEAAGITHEDVDVIAVNGLPNKILRSTPDGEELRVHREGKVHYVPHHLSHGASTFFLSGFDSARVIVVDGRGERDTATVYDAD